MVAASRGSQPDPLWAGGQLIDGGCYHNPEIVGGGWRMDLGSSLLLHTECWSLDHDGTEVSGV